MVIDGDSLHAKKKEQLIPLLSSVGGFLCYFMKPKLKVKKPIFELSKLVLLLQYADFDFALK